MTVAVPAEGRPEPTPVMVTDVAFGTLHDRVEDWPAVIVGGVAVKRETLRPRWVVTEVLAVAESPLTVSVTVRRKP